MGGCRWHLSGHVGGGNKLACPLTCQPAWHGPKTATCTILKPAAPVPSHIATHTNSCTQPKSEKIVFAQKTTLAPQTREHKQ